MARLVHKMNNSKERTYLILFLKQGIKEQIIKISDMHVMQICQVLLSWVLACSEENFHETDKSISH